MSVPASDSRALAEAAARTLPAGDVPDFGATLGRQLLDAPARSGVGLSAAKPGAPAPSTHRAFAATVAAEASDPMRGPHSVDARSLPRLATARGTDEPLADLVVTGVLGEGGMGVVELARQRSLQREVALKRLRGEAAPGALVEALLREATFTGYLEHPNIVPVHALGRDEHERPLLVMKKIEGTTLAMLLHNPSHPGWARAGPERLGFLLRALRAVCDALAFAHSRGVLHRDVKPENVMLGPFGEVYLLDWGVATSRNASVGEAIVGTPAYMAPEMLHPATGEIDERTDVYLVGATLHECLTGAPPHVGNAIVEVFVSVARSAPRAYGDDVPEEVAEIARRAMHADRLRRFESADALGRALSDFERHRAAAELARVAEARLAELEGAIRREDVDVVDPLFHECRFGLEQALRDWPENARARDALRRATARMCEFHLAQKNRAGAAALLAALDPKPDDLVAGLARLDAEIARISEERARLRRLDHDMDATVAEPERRRALGAVALAMLLLAVALGTAHAFGLYESTPPRMLAITVPAALVLVLIFVRYRRRFLTNRVNLHMALTVAFAGIAVITNRALGVVRARPFADVASGDALLISLVAAVAAISLRRVYLVPAVVFLLCSFLVFHVGGLSFLVLLLGAVVSMAAVMRASARARAPLLDGATAARSERTLRERSPDGQAGPGGAVEKPPE